MTATRETILNAAMTLFLQNGVRGTTMSRIAEAAGVTRQTVYNTWKNREEVLRAAVRLVGERQVAEARRAWAEAGSLSEKIDIFFAAGPLHWWDHLVASPASADLLENVPTEASDEMARIDDEWRAAIADLLRPYADRLSALGQTPESYADFLFSAGKAAKYQSTDRDQFVARLGALKASALALLGEPPDPAVPA